MTESSKKMIAWTNDASGIDVAHLEQVPYCRTALRTFLDNGVGSLERVLVAPKGYGKTLYLKYKSHLIRQKYHKSIPIFPAAKPGIEFLKLSLDWKEMLHDVARLSIDNWSVVWQFVLIAKGLQLVDGVGDVDDYLKSLLKSPSEPVGDLLTAVLRDRDHFGATTSHRLRIVRKLFNDCGRDAVIFVDNADEMFVGLDRPSQLREAKQRTEQDNAGKQEAQRQIDAENSAEIAKSNPSMWKAAQVGLLLAVREIERSAPSLSVYTSLRAEAVYTAEHPDAAQARSYTLPIRYTEEDLEQIVAWHVNMMDDEDLLPSTDAPAIDRLMGAEPLEHRYVRIAGQAATERPFDLVMRHTTFSPRDLVIIGRHISQLSINERKSPLRAVRIRKAIDDAVGELMKYFYLNAIPRWESHWGDAVHGLDSPVLTWSQANDKLGVTASKLYCYGLLGIAEGNGSSGEYTQSFLTQWDGAYAAQDLPLPRSDYYFLHPWLFDDAKRHNPKFMVDAHNIIGNGCRFVAPKSLAISIGVDANGNPALWTHDGIAEVMDIPGDPSTGSKLPMGAVFLFCVLLACRKAGSNKVDAEELLKGREQFDLLFPHHQQAEMLRPFDDSEHRSHLKPTVAKQFPRFQAKLDMLQGSIAIVGPRGGTPTGIEINCLNADRIVIRG